MKKAIILFFVIILFFSSNHCAQAILKNQLNHAEDLFNRQLYFDAITEYKRLNFFDSAKVFLYQSNYRIGECYKAGAHFDEAIKYFRFAEINASANDQIYKSKINIVRCNILRKTTDQALSILKEMENDSRFRAKQDSINYWRGWVYIFADDWKNASISFNLINHSHELKLLSEKTERSKVSVTFAKVISYILPGSGLIYTGKVIPGLLSMGWNLLAGYWTINSFAEQRVFDGLAVGDLVLVRFYRGSIQYAESAAVEKNIAVSNKSLLFLQNEYKGLKP